ncbi:MAG: GNAT family N-acetyltransferase [Anaerolineae bacterium]
MEVLELQDQDKGEWDKYVYDSPQATIFHLAGWKDVMEDTFGLRSHYLFAREGNQILGVLPLLYVKSRLSSHFFTSMPSAICARNDETARALVERAKELVKASGAKYLILRDSYRKWNLPDLVTNENHCTLVVKLCDDPEQIWRRLDRRVRQHTRKANRAGLEVVIGPDYLEALYPAYSRAMRDLGTPTLGLAFFRNMMRQFPAHFTTVVVRHDREALGGAFAAFFRDTIYNTWGGMLRQSFSLRSSHIWYWETLKYGCENGFQWIDLGRSQLDSGTYTFKKLWLSEPRPLYQQCYLNSVSQPPPVGSTRADDVQYRAFVRVWRHLPLSMTEFLGPCLRKRMPFG